MTQAELNRSVAHVTGEDLSEIRHRGFSIADPVDVQFDPEPPIARDPQIVDWDELALQRVSLFP